MPLYAGYLGADDAYIGLIAAVSPFAGILLSFPVGVLSDKIGRKKLLTLAGCVLVTTPLLYFFISDAICLIPIRFFHGMATAILGPVAAAVIAESYGERKGEMMGTYGSATLVGRTLAPLLGGAVLTSVAILPAITTYHLVYLIAFISAVPALILVLIFRDKPSATISSLSFSDFTGSFKTFLTNRDLRSASCAEMAVYFCFGVFETFLPLYLLASGVNVWITGVIFAS